MAGILRRKLAFGYIYQPEKYKGDTDEKKKEIQDGQIGNAGTGVSG